MARAVNLPTFPLARLGEALQVLAGRSGLPTEGSDALIPRADLATDATGLSRWIEAAAATLGLEAEPVALGYPTLRRDLPMIGPALLRLPGSGEARFLAILDGGRGKLRLLAPSSPTDERVSAADLRDALAQDREAPLIGELDELLEQAGVSAGRRAQVRGEILRERLGGEQIAGCWLLRLPPGAPVKLQLKQARLAGRMVGLALAHLAEYVAWTAAWWLVGLGALQGRFDQGWLIAWAMLLATMIPLRMVTTWLQGVLALTGGGILKRRVLAGALRLEPDETRREGVGQALGRVIEAEAVESLALSGGFLAVVSLIELIVAAAVLAAGAGGGLEALCLAAWFLLALGIGWRYLKGQQRWAAVRLHMTHDLVERLIGHRTRLAQERPERWHAGEDQELEQYLEQSARMDRLGSILLALIPNGWLALGLLALAPSFVSGGATPAALAIAVGGILLAQRALKRLATGMWQVVGAWIAWQQVSPLFHAAGRPRVEGSPAYAARSADDGGERQPVIEAHDLTFRYPGRAEAVLSGASVRVFAGDRLLLEGASGGGKSTLASLLTGLRMPDSGLILVEGLDRQTLGEVGWRRRIVFAPQFHENYLLTGTVAFNLLMGRGWPPEEKDFAEMETICRELGLEDLLKRMPSGLQQMVGESGWQLSHGERSRLYMARALLQDADLVILDESFAALDPENLRRAHACAMARAKTLLVIAHR